MIRLRKIFYSFLFIIGPLLANGQSLQPYRAAFKGPLQNWVHSFNYFKLSDFKLLTAQGEFENKNVVQSKNNRQFYPVYKPALSVSPNGKLVIDIYSHLLLTKKNGKLVSNGTDVEQGVLLGDVQPKKWRQIAYYGYSQRVQEVYWVDNDTFILAGTLLDKGKNLPLIIVGHIQTERFQVFESADCYQKQSGYTSPKIKALHIQQINR